MFYSVIAKINVKARIRSKGRRMVMARDQENC